MVVTIDSDANLIQHSGHFSIALDILANTMAEVA